MGALGKRTSDIAVRPLSSTWEERVRVRRFARDRVGTALPSWAVPRKTTPHRFEGVQSHLTLSLSPQWRRGNPPIRSATGHRNPSRIT